VAAPRDPPGSKVQEYLPAAQGVGAPVHIHGRLRECNMMAHMGQSRTGVLNHALPSWVVAKSGPCHKALAPIVASESQALRPPAPHARPRSGTLFLGVTSIPAVSWRVLYPGHRPPQGSASPAALKGSRPIASVTKPRAGKSLGELCGARVPNERSTGFLTVARPRRGCLRPRSVGQVTCAVRQASEGEVPVAGSAHI
jgi:hypothetical protein